MGSNLTSRNQSGRPRSALGHSLARGPARRWRSARPGVESLEGRLVLSTLTVTSPADDGPGSLRAAVLGAHGGDTIQFSPALKGQAIHLTCGEIAIGQGLTILGPGAGKLEVDAGGHSRVFDVTAATASVTLSGLTISGGSAAQGGGVLVQGAP